MGQLGRFLLVLALAFSAPAAAVRGPEPNAAPTAAPTSYREDGILGLTMARYPHSGQVCQFGQVTLGFIVNNVSPGVEVPIPVVEAMITVQDDKGATQRLITRGNGYAEVSWPAETAGQLRFTVDAQKQYYTAARPLTFQVQVVPCKWVLKVNYHEEFAIIAEVQLVVGAYVDWSGYVSAGPPNADSGTSTLTVTGSGSYRFYASDKIQAPIHISVDPPVSGDWGLNGDGSADSQTVKLNIGAVLPGQYPKMVTLKVTDYGPSNIQVNYKPPAPYIGGNGAFLEANKLNNLTFPADGGNISLSSGMSTFFWTDTRTAYSLDIMLYKVRDLPASTSGSLALADPLR